MKFIIDENELAKIKLDAERVGHAKAEQLVAVILAGERNILFKEDTSSEQKSVMDMPNNVWAELIRRLDKPKLVLT